MSGRKRRVSPSFVGYKPSPSASVRSKQGNRAKGTKPEVLLAQSLGRSGIAHRLNVAELPGKPDFVFEQSRTAVFCDGIFWHGKDWESLRPKLERGSNASYWVTKISYNIERDKGINKSLADLGWRVVRVWEDEILSNLDGVTERLLRFATATCPRRYHEPSA